jgi:hypothetical protein
VSREPVSPTIEDFQDRSELSMVAGVVLRQPLAHTRQSAQVARSSMVRRSQYDTG